MTLTEHSINDSLAEVLKKTRCVWRTLNVVRSEELNVIYNSSERPDIIVMEPHVSPVIIETEVLPAITVESEAKSRLGKLIKPSRRKILSSIAVRLPERFRSKQGRSLLEEIQNAHDLEFTLFTGNDPQKYTRWPSSGWLTGGIADLSWLIQSASVPPEIIDEAADTLIEGVSAVASLLSEGNISNPGMIQRLCGELYQEYSEQTLRMAATILMNAFVFHRILAGGSVELNHIITAEELDHSKPGLIIHTVIKEWKKILEINYWPVFDIAKRILIHLPAYVSYPILEVLYTTADDLVKKGVMRSHDLTGAVFQRLIVDRKFLAAFYTTPPSAALLATLALRTEMLSGERSWSNPEDIKNLRIGDFACGTGTLLTSAYKRLSYLHELNHGSMEALHSEMMANSIIGCDVMPAAAHLTASMLAGANPTIKYDQSWILTVPYGKQQNGEFALGSLNLLDPQGMLGILTITAKALEATGETAKEDWIRVPDKSFDLLIMNPPFTRATGHEGAKIGVPVPMFAAFASSPDEQRAMSKAAEKLAKGTCYHGNAGEASLFLALADRKIKPGGMLALVMPLSLLSGEAWEKSRGLLTKYYENLIVITISGVKNSELSFSADTGMGECLVIGKKKMNGNNNGNNVRAIFSVLPERPSNTIVGTHIAERISQLINSSSIRRLEDGPVGGTSIRFGNDYIGQVLDAPILNSEPWGVSRIADLSLAQVAWQMIHRSRLWLPGTDESDVIDLPIRKLGEIGKIGPYHADINWSSSAGGVRGPFEIHPVLSGQVPTYPVLWAHNASNERTLCFEADCEGISRIGKSPEETQLIKNKVKNIWSTASHCHFNRDFRFNSQSTAMQFTKRKTIGGRAWTSISLESMEFEKTQTLWANTSLGLILYWWCSNKPQSGRGMSGREMLHNFPVLDVTKLTRKQIEEMVLIFDQMCHKELKPFHEIDGDPVRRELDELVARRVFRIDERLLADDAPLDILRKKLSCEPSIRGSK